MKSNYHVIGPFHHSEVRAHTASGARRLAAKNHGLGWPSSAYTAIRDTKRLPDGTRIPAPSEWLPMALLAAATIAILAVTCVVFP